jgi:hypothetical protein
MCDVITTQPLHTWRRATSSPGDTTPSPNSGGKTPHHVETQVWFRQRGGLERNG